MTDPYREQAKIEIEATPRRLPAWAGLLGFASALIIAAGALVERGHAYSGSALAAVAIVWGILAIVRFDKGR